jgi:hypothetical protein
VNRKLRVSSGLLVAALILTGCQLLGGGRTSPSPEAQQTPQEAPEVSGAATQTAEAGLATVEVATATPTVPTTEGAQPAPAIQRIQFDPGTSSATRKGYLLANQEHIYVFGAQGGQQALVEVGSSDGSANFSLSAMNGSIPLKTLDDPARSWQGILPDAPEYVIGITGPHETTYWLSLTSDPSGQADLPVIMDPGSPPSNRCVAAHPGGTAEVVAYLGPSTVFAPVARLGNWAEVLNGEVGWVQIQIGPGETGWIRETDVVFAGPCDHINLPTRLEVPPSGSPWRSSGFIQPGQVDRYVFYAEQGQRLLVEVSSASPVIFVLAGLDDGQPLKSMGVEARTWEGVMTYSQDYMLTVFTEEVAADYSLLVALQPAPPFAVFYDAHTGALLGGFQDAFWLDGGTAAPALLGGERFSYYRLGQRLGEATGLAAVPIDGICPGHTVELTPPPAHAYALAVAGVTWEVAPRLVAPVELSTIERLAVADLLGQQGLSVSAAALQVQEALGTDLDGDGTGEILVQAARLKDGGSTLAVDAGDYMVVAVLMQISGQLHAEPLALDVYPQAGSQAYPWRYQVTGALDLNGDGNLEVVVAGDRWEGKSTRVFGVGTAGGAVPVLQRQCSQ